MVWRCAAIAGLGGILFGFDVSVIAGTNELMKTEFSLSPDQLGLTVSSAFWGALTGILLAGMLSGLDKINVSVPVAPAEGPELKSPVSTSLDPLSMAPKVNGDGSTSSICVRDTASAELLVMVAV